MGGGGSLYGVHQQGVLFLLEGAHQQLHLRGTLLPTDVHLSADGAPLLSTTALRQTAGYVMGEPRSLYGRTRKSHVHCGITCR